MMPPEFDRDNQGNRSMFDFLDEDGEERPRERPRPVAVAQRERPLPIIRKPVPVSESGPLRAPSADEVHDDFGFLREAPPGRHSPAAPVDDVSFDDGRRGWVRPTLLLLAFTLLGAGAIMAAWTYLPLGADAPERATTTAGVAPEPSTPEREVPAPEPAPTDGAEREPDGTPAAAPVRSLGVRFREAVANVEALVDDGNLDEAERTLATLDRAVYGYGIAEFTELETRIESLRGGGAAPAAVTGGADRETERAAEAQREAERAAEADREAERAAEERRAAAEEVARAERARLEAERVAARERRERNAAERSARENEAARARAEAREAARRRAEPSAPAGEADASGRGTGVASSTSSTADADAAATTAAAAAAAAAAGTAPADVDRGGSSDERATALEADRRATDRRIAEQRAAVAAEERRLAALETPTPAPRPASEPEPEPAPVARARAGIDDEDLRVVYASLIELKNAFENRDIAAVITLSDPPSGRIQQLLQIFANSQSVKTRITNVSARPVDDAVTGVLRIEDVRRADGSRIRPPPEIETIALTSTRDGDGWSALSW